MQCSLTLAREHDYGHVKMKNYNNYKNSYKKDGNVDIKQLCLRLSSLRGREGMPACSADQAEAIRRYYEAFPALDQRAPPAPPAPPAWPRTMPAAPAPPPPPPPHAHPRRRRHSYCKKQRRHRDPARDPDLPEWMHHEGVWDMEAHDPVKEFIRAIALDEGYGTGDPGPDAPRLGDKISDWEPAFDVRADWALVDEPEPAPESPGDASLYEQFAAKFDRSLAALWDVPDDLCQLSDELCHLPVDLNLLLQSPSDAPTELPERLRPLRLEPSPPPACLAPLELPDEDVAAALPAVADTLRSFTALNHSRDGSGFAEVPPRRRAAAPPPAPPPPAPRPPPPREDLLTAARTHFRPIHREPADPAPRYADGDTFDIRGELESVDFRTSPAGHTYLHGRLYLEYRTRVIDYDRLRLTAEQRCPDLDDDGFRLRFPLRQTDAAVQTDPAPECPRPKKMRAGEAAWRRAGETGEAVGAGEAGGGAGGLGAELAREWDELQCELRAALQGADRKRRHSAARRSPEPPAAAACSHPHARFLHCCPAPADRPLTR